jgi:hypothetical protein
VIDEEIGAALSRLVELRYARKSDDAPPPCYQRFVPMAHLFDFSHSKTDSLLERLVARTDRLRIFWAYDRMLRKQTRAITKVRIRSVIRGSRLSLKQIAADDRVLREASRRMWVAAVLFLFGDPGAVELARVSCDELIRVFGSPEPNARTQVTSQLQYKRL